MYTQIVLAAKYACRRSRPCLLMRRLFAGGGGDATAATAFLEEDAAVAAALVDIDVPLDAPLVVNS